MKRLVLLLWLLPACTVLAEPVPAAPAVPVASLSAEQQQRYEHLIGELRCVVCQNETLKASQAPLAADLREEVREQIKAGKSNRQIEDYLVARYGQFVLYHPRFEPETWALWLAPGMVLLVALFVALRVLRRRAQPGSEAEVDAETIARIVADRRADKS